MNSFRIVFEISKWEFFRWFKLKDQFTTLLISAGISLAVWGGKALVDKSDKENVRLAVLNQHVLPIAMPEGSNILLEPSAPEQEQTLREAVRNRELDGILILKSIDEAELLVYKHPLWKSELEQHLTQTRLVTKIGTMGIPPEQFADALQPFSVKTVFDETAKEPTSTGEKVAAGIIISLMMIAVFVSFAYQFVTITGEKQLRVTEQIISAVSPQQWIDGKILGVTAHAFASLGTYVLSIMIFIGMSGAFGEGLAIPIEVTQPLVVVTLALLGLCGLLFWNTFFAAVAATINDPNTSARGAMIVLPVVPTVIAALLALKNPDSTLMQALALLPISSPTALSARLVLTDVPLWEIVGAFALLIVSTWLMRSAAVKIFHLGILMYGKEPGFKEMIRWAREA